MQRLEESKKAPVYTFFPSLLKGAGLTVFISAASMALAIALGLVLTLLRLYGRSPLGALAAAYVEVYRGTPLLIQLYILYYGHPNIGVSLSPLLAAFIGLGMNYAAYESELYRAGINAVPKGQMEAALSLGMTRRLALRRIIMPQAMRVTLPGITNDFRDTVNDSANPIWATCCANGSAIMLKTTASSESGMSTTAILQAAIERLDIFVYVPQPPIAWPGIKTQPPHSSMWLQASFFPNESIDIAWDDEACAETRGFFQVLVCYRPGVGQLEPSRLADALIEHFPKGLELGPVRVRKRPWQSPAIVPDSSMIYIPVTVPYSGLT